MVTTRGRSKSAAVNKDLVNTAGSFLETLPEKPKEVMSLREAMKYLREPIQAALAKGYNYPDLADLLGQQGISISATTLKNYVPTGKRQAAKEKKAATASTQSKRGRKSKGSSVDELATNSESVDLSSEVAQSNGSSPDAASTSTTGRATRGSKSGPTAKSAPATRAKTSTRAKSSTTRPAAKSTGGRKKASS